MATAFTPKVKVRLSFVSVVIMAKVLMTTLSKKEDLWEVHDLSISKSDLALSEYGPPPPPAFGCQARSIDIHLTPRRWLRAKNAGKQISGPVGCKEA